MRDWRKTLVRNAEAAVAVFVVLICFLGFMAIVSVSLPRGTSLQELMLDRRWTGRDAGRSSVELDVPEPEIGTRPVAMLAGTRRLVKDKRSDGIAWRQSESGMVLGDRHSVQTYERAGATISFGARNLLQLGENSLIVVRDPKADRASTASRASMVFLEGQLDGRLGDPALDELEVVTANGSTLLIPERAGNADFQVTVNPDATTTFSVYGGPAEVTSGGRTVALQPNQSVTVTGSMPPELPQALPGRPRPTAPATGAVYRYRSLPPRIRFRWSGEQEAYRLVIARDPELRDVVYDERVRADEFTHGNLDVGRYYWRVAGLAGWAEGPPSATRKLETIRDGEPPALHVSFPERPVHGESFVLRGTVEPGAEVFIGNRSVPTSGSGEFEYALDLRRGPNVVVVEAVDAAGNITYRSTLVDAKY